MVEIYEQEEVSFDPTQVQFIIQRGRGQKTEFYPILPDDSSQLSKTVCSLANSGGGQVLLGVSKEGTIVGVDDSDIESKAAEIIKQKIERIFDLKFSTAPVEIDENLIIVILISEFSEFPLASDGRFYQRHQKDDIRLSPEQVYRLMNRASND